MAVSLKHQFTSAKSDGGDTTLVQPSNWNAEHTLTLATDKLLGRISSGTGAVEEVTCTDFAQSLLDDADAAAARATLGVRDVLSANRTYYVRTDGSDSNNGLANTAGGAFLTLQKAWDTIVTLDLNGFTATIKIGNTYTLTAGLNASVAPVGGNVIIEGDTATPSNTVISTTSADAIQITSSSKVTVQYIKVQTTTSGYGLVTRAPGAVLIIGNGMEYGACASGHVLAYSGRIEAASSATGYTIAGASVSHFRADLNGIVVVSTLAVTISGAPAFSWAFAVANTGGVIDVFGFSVASGSATGSRYSANSNSVINTYGGGASYLAGDSAGATATGGQYV
jgi:hypothetical protein